jgi:hypothetical protein
VSGDILDTIDHVLADYEVSGDAMRWTPEPQPEPMYEGLARLRAVSPASMRTEAYGRLFAHALIGAQVAASSAGFDFGSAA